MFKNNFRTVYDWIIRRAAFSAASAATLADAEILRAFEHGVHKSLSLIDTAAVSDLGFTFELVTVRGIFLCDLLAHPRLSRYVSGKK